MSTPALVYPAATRTLHAPLLVPEVCKHFPDQYFPRFCFNQNTQEQGGILLDFALLVLAFRKTFVFRLTQFPHQAMGMRRVDRL